jgi:diguanylate cyclase (GGDEF)-like protein/PAS domain S-box-containing protein
MNDFTVVRLLYIEDDPGLVVLMQKNLQRRGFHIDIATNGEDGLKMIAANKYDLALLDYNLPFLGGMEVLRELSMKGLPIPVIMVTGEGNETIAVEALKLGAADYIVKDVEMRYLDLIPAVIDKVLYKQLLVKERNQMQQAMQESEERYRLLVELSPDGIALHVDGKYVFINPAGAHLLGASHRDQIIGLPTMDIVHPDFRELVKSRVEQLEKQVDMVPWVEEQFVRIDGTAFDVEVASIKFSYEGKFAIQTIFKDITERKQVELKLKQMALYDTLTGLPNRTLFYDRFNQLLELAKRNQYILALMYVDLDRFKTINDTLGHEVGDLVLITAGQRMVSCTRRSDTIARIGGDEFVGICGRIAAPADAAVVAEKVIKSLTEPYRVKNHECTLGASIGISIYPQDGEDAETLVSKADTAMYRSKAGGKGGYQFFSEVLDAPPSSDPEKKRRS